MAAIDVVNRVYREYIRYTGDGKPGEPVNAPLPIGDRQSGTHSPDKASIRAALMAPLTEAGAEADRARDEADRALAIADSYDSLQQAVLDAQAEVLEANNAADRAETAAAGVEYPVSYGVAQSLSPDERRQARENIGIPVSFADYLFGSVEQPELIVPVGAQDQEMREIGNVLYDPEDLAAPYKMVYSGYVPPQVGTNVFVYWASSQDGRSWTKRGRLLTRASEDPYLVKHNGTYFLYVEDKQPAQFRNTRLHTSPDFTTWTDRGDVLVYNGAPWESSDVSSPCVIVENNTFYLFYEGRGGSSQNGALGLATSSDGVTFTKFAGNPIVTGYETAPDGVRWAYTVVPDDIRKIGNTFVMTIHPNYLRSADATQLSSVGIMVSQDLYNWVDPIGRPISLPAPNTRSTLMFFERDGELLILSEDRAVGIQAFYPKEKATRSWELYKINGTNNQSVTTAGAWNKVTFPNLEMGADDSFNLSTSVFSPPASGMYRFSVNIQVNPGASSGRVDFLVRLNGAAEAIMGGMYVQSGLNYVFQGSATLYLKPGDVCESQVERNANITTTLTLSKGRLSIEQLW